uniref:Expressed protein n=1 Tax=Echinococcus granulosus TaxID=6210 RepID=A0A068WSS8_ECHGR|nr:expressed protein [Echinococcus granulosus]
MWNHNSVGSIAQFKGPQHQFHLQTVLQSSVHKGYEKQSIQNDRKIRFAEGDSKQQDICTEFSSTNLF